MSVTPTEAALAQARSEGVIQATVAEHSKHLDKINGSMTEIAKQGIEQVKKMGEIALTMQRIQDSAVARETVVAATAETLKQAADANSAKVTRLIAILTALVGALSFAALYLGFHK